MGGILDSQYLIGRIDDLERLIDRIPQSILREDLIGLVIEVLSYVIKVIDINELNRVLIARENVDIHAIGRVAEIIETKNLQGPLHLFSERELDPTSLLRDYRSFVQQLREDSIRLSSPNLGLRLDFGSHSLTDLLICAAATNVDLPEIVDMVKVKLNLLDDDQIIRIWSRIQTEFSPDRSCSMEVRPGSLPANWLKTVDISHTKQKIADYLVSLKWRLAVEMFQAGRYTIPSETPSLAQILAISAAAAAVPLTQIELEIARGMARLYFYWSRILNQTSSDFLRTTGLSQPTFLDSHEYQAVPATTSLPRAGSEILILLELRKVVRASHSFASHETPIEKALFQYKLGTEVMAPEIIEQMTKKNELSLQKELCKFLIERGIYAMGTKFGRSETDLLAELPDEGFIIETKIYKESKRVGVRVIKSNLVQLQSYMDQNPVHRKGVLVIYNFSSVLITAPRRWIAGRFWFLPINLQKQPPSGRDRSIMIEPSEGSDLIRVLTIVPPIRETHGEKERVRIR